MAKPGYVYILASDRNGTLYVGVTADLVRRVHEHREGLVPGFTKQHGVRMLVHVEPFDDIALAIAREKAIKKWRRAWKLELIERNNPDWRDLWTEVTGFPLSRNDGWGFVPMNSNPHGSELRVLK